MTDITTDDNDTCVATEGAKPDAMCPFCFRPASEHKRVSKDDPEYGTMGDVISNMLKDLTTKQPSKKIANCAELEYAVYSTFNGVFDSIETKRSYAGLVITVPLANGQTGKVTVDVTKEDKKSASGLIG